MPFPLIGRQAGFPVEFDIVITHVVFFYLSSNKEYKKNLPTVTELSSHLLQCHINNKAP